MTNVKRGISEKDFQLQVTEVAQLTGWRVYHTYDSRRCEAGYPDLTLAHPQRGFIMAELKTDTGRLTTAQKDWIVTLRECGVEVHIWRPRDFEAIAIRLQKGPVEPHEKPHPYLRRVPYTLDAERPPTTSLPPGSPDFYQIDSLQGHRRPWRNSGRTRPYRPDLHRGPRLGEQLL